MSLQEYFNEQYTPCLRFCIVGGNGKEYSIEGIIDNWIYWIRLDSSFDCCSNRLENQP